MTITAKYAATCPCCNRPISVGDKIEWSKGSKARHAACAASGSQSATAAPRASNTVSSRRPVRSTGRGTWTGCSCGSVEEYERNSDCGSCRHDRY